jgi:ferric-dicitrate binding protein FerR (iron transport regulator)
MKRLLAVLVAVAVTAPLAGQPRVAYSFDEVRRKVLLTSGELESRVSRGHTAYGGDKVTTGWFSYARIANERYRAKFEIFSSTDVLLAEGTPGVLLSIERGRIRAAFDTITGGEPRIVKTPGALLTVRGTKFDVEVSAAGDSTVDVFEGILEVRSMLTREPVTVRAGQQTTFGRTDAPVVRPMPEERRRNGPDADADPHRPVR